MTDVRVAGLRSRYSEILDEDVPADLWVADFGSDIDAVSMRHELRDVFREHPDVHRVLVRVDGQPIGFTGRDTASRDLGHAGADGGPGSAVDPGSSDGATLPGHSGDYRLITFVCALAACGTRELRSYYDVRTVPGCPHGPMRVQP